MNPKLFVANVSWSTTEADLHALFAEVGDVVSVKIPADRDTGKSKGFAFIEMASPDLAQAAINVLHGREVNGRELVVVPQDPSRQRTADAGGRYSRA